ncbi:MAG: YraN family protein [Bacteroidales bacterium]
MAEHNKLGKSGEQIAVEYLQKKGYKILETNWHAGKFEIDIIASISNQIIIAEVKTRTSTFLMEPEAAVNKEKQRMLAKAADIYVQRNEIDKEVRFDIISVVIVRDEFRIKHIEDAFYTTM